MKRQTQQPQQIQKQGPEIGTYLAIGLIVLGLVFGAGIYIASRPSPEFKARREAQKIESAERLTVVRDIVLIIAAG